MWRMCCCRVLQVRSAPLTEGLFIWRLQSAETPGESEGEDSREMCWPILWPLLISLPRYSVFVFYKCSKDGHSNFIYWFSHLWKKCWCHCGFSRTQAAWRSVHHSESDRNIYTTETAIFLFTYIHVPQRIILQRHLCSSEEGSSWFQWSSMSFSLSDNYWLDCYSSHLSGNCKRFAVPRTITR